MHSVNCLEYTCILKVFHILVNVHALCKLFGEYPCYCWYTCILKVFHIWDWIWSLHSSGRGTSQCRQWECRVHQEWREDAA